MRSWSRSFGAVSIVAICVASGVAGGSTMACSSFTSDDSAPDAGGDACDAGGCVSLDGCAEKTIYVSAAGNTLNESVLAVFTAGAVAAISNDAIEGAADGAMTLGVELTDSGAVRAERNTVYGGAGKAPAGGEAVGSVGFFSIRSGPLTIHESAIHGGIGTSPVNVGSLGLALAGGERPAKVTNSLLYGGSGTGSGSSSKAVAAFGADVELEGNIVHGGDARCSSAGCRTTGIELGGGKNRIAGNIIFGGNLPATAAVANRRVAASCSEAGCFAPVGCETTAAKCSAAVFSDFDETSLGAADVIGQEPGLHLGTGACDFTDGGKADAAVPFDFFGSPRTPPTSFGAHEQETCAE